MEQKDTIIKWDLGMDVVIADDQLTNLHGYNAKAKMLEEVSLIFSEAGRNLAPFQTLWILQDESDSLG